MRKQRQIELVPTAPTAESRIIRRHAKLLDQQRKTLGDVSLEALRLATMQLAVKKLEEGLKLLSQSGLERTIASVSATEATRPAPVVQHPCVMCGREGVYQSKRARIRGPGTSGQPAPFYCQTHAQFVMAEDAEDRRAEAVAPSMKTEAAAPAPQPEPSAPVRSPGLDAAMASLRGERA